MKWQFSFITFGHSQLCACTSDQQQLINEKIIQRPGVFPVFEGSSKRSYSGCPCEIIKRKVATISNTGRASKVGYCRYPALCILMSRSKGLNSVNPGQIIQPQVRSIHPPLRSIFFTRSFIHLKIKTYISFNLRKTLSR